MFLVGPANTGLVVIVPLYVVAIGLHLWRIREVMASLGSPAKPWFVAVASVVGLGLALAGLTSG